MLPRQFGDTLVNLVPHLVRCNGPQLAGGDFDSDVELARVFNVDDHRVRPVAPGQKTRNQLNRVLRGGEADPNGGTVSQSLQSLQGERQVRAALIVGDSVDLVHDYRLHGLQDFAALFCRQQDVERLRRRNKDVWRAPKHGATLVHQGVAGAHRGADLRHEESALTRQLQDFAQRSFQVPLDIVSQRLQGRDVENFGLVHHDPNTSIMTAMPYFDGSTS